MELNQDGKKKELLIILFMQPSGQSVQGDGFSVHSLGNDLIMIPIERRTLFKEASFDVMLMSHPP